LAGRGLESPSLTAQRPRFISPGRSCSGCRSCAAGRPLPGRAAKRIECCWLLRNAAKWWTKGTKQLWPSAAYHEKRPGRQA